MWSEKRARLALSCAVDGGEPEAARLVAQLGAQGAWAKIGEGALGEPLARRVAATDVEVVERLAARVGARFVVPGEEEWAAGLDDLAQVDPIQRRGGVPFGVWLRGPGHLSALTSRSVAVVGSRAATAYGSGVATDLGAELATAAGMTAALRSRSSPSRAGRA